MLGADTVIFYSTITSASAVLVAIVGGFLVSRLVALSSEQEAIERRYAQLVTERDERTGTAAIQELEISESSRLRFIEMNAPLFASADGNVPEEMIENPENHDQQLIATWSNALQEQINESRRRALKVWPKDRLSATTDELTGLGLETDGLEATVVDSVIRRITETKRAELRLNIGNDTSESLFGIGIGLSDTWSANQRQRIETLTAQKAQIAIIESQIFYVEGELSDIAPPVGVYWGLAALIVLAIVGVIFPLSLLLQQPVPSSHVLRTVVFGCFIGGLAVVLIFIGVQIQAVGRRGDSAIDVK